MENLSNIIAPFLNDSIKKQLNNYGKLLLLTVSCGENEDTWNKCYLGFTSNCIKVVLSDFIRPFCILKVN